MRTRIHLVVMMVAAALAAGCDRNASARDRPTGPMPTPRVRNEPAREAEPVRELGCPEPERVRRPTEADPEAGDFTLDEALAELSGDGHPVAVIDTTFGTIRCALADTKAPRSVANFIGLARGVRPWWDPCEKAWVKRPFYDGLTFHRVIPGFMVQGGDQYGDGSGDAGYEFANEPSPDLRHDRAGTLAYANHGRDTNGSQFYITVGPRPQLDGGYTVFGYCDAPDVANRIAGVPRDMESNRPNQPVVIRSIRIERGGS